MAFYDGKSVYPLWSALYSGYLIVWKVKFFFSYSSGKVRKGSTVQLTYTTCISSMGEKRKVSVPIEVYLGGGSVNV